ncbi:MAG: hypothetical protein ACRYFU_16040 [Janthinobacterium lividum]
MAGDEKATQKPIEPRGFGEHSRGLAGEYAHEQGWGLDADERSKQPDTPQDPDGGTDYEYGARDFGDTPVNTAIEHTNNTQNEPAPTAATSKE